MIDWRKKVDKKFLYTKKDELKNKNIDEIDDKDLIIKLGGVMEVMRLRGFDKVEYEYKHVHPDYVTVKCRVTWKQKTIKDDEGNEVTLDSEVFESLASAQREHLSDFMKPYMETCAENRALVRAGRRYLGIDIVSDEEINNAPPPVKTVDASAPKTAFAKLYESRKYTMDSFKEEMRELANNHRLPPEIFEEIDTWKSIDDISTNLTRKIMGVIQTLDSQQ